MRTVSMTLPLPRSTVFWGGRQISAGSDLASGGTGSGRTIVSVSPVRGIRQDGFVTRVDASIGVNTGANSLRFLLMRPNGTSFDVVAKTDPIAVAPGTGTKQFDVSLGPFLMGDRIGVWLNGSGAGGSISLAVQSDAALQMGYIEGLAAGGETYITSGLTFDIMMTAYGNSPIFATNGESIIAGHNRGAGNYWYPPYEPGGPSGQRLSDPFYSVAQSLPGADYQNFAVGGSTWAMVLSRTADMVASDPDCYLFAAGTNDWVLGNTWLTAKASMDAVRAMVPSSKKMYVCECVPYTGTDADASAIRANNANYATWCAANNAILVPTWATMGQLRPSTGFNDDLKTAYSVGDGHLTTAGVAALSAAIFDVVKNYAA